MVIAPDIEAPVFGPPIVDLVVYGKAITQGSFDPTANPLRRPIQSAIALIKMGKAGAAIGVLEDALDLRKTSGFRHAKKDELLEWRNDIERAVLRHRGRDAPTIDGPVVVTLTFIVAPIQSPKWGALPCGREGDSDKMLRAVVDGLGRNRQKDPATGITYYTGAAVMKDDNRMVFGCSGKVYAEPGEPPGVMIRVWAVDGAAAKAGWVPVPDWPGWRYVQRSSLLDPLMC